MGSYAMRPTLGTVELANGELASVYVYSHKGWNDRAEGQATRWYENYGDRLHDWVIMGFKNDRTGKVEVDAESDAKKIGKRWLVNDDWFAGFDCNETSKPVHIPSGNSKLQLVRSHREVTEKTEDGEAGYYYTERLIKGVWVRDARRTAWRSFSCF